MGTGFDLVLPLVWEMWHSLVPSQFGSVPSVSVVELLQDPVDGQTVQ